MHHSLVGCFLIKNLGVGQEICVYLAKLNGAVLDKGLSANLKNETDNTQR